VTRRCAVRSLLDLVLVTALLVAYGSSPWAWLGGPVSALFIWAAAVDVEPYAARYRSHRVGIFGVARLMNSTGAGGFGE
jgi:hypothetical protein